MPKLLNLLKPPHLLILLILSTPLFAAELAGVKLPDNVTLEGQPKVLNGLGLRLATFFKVKVYVAGLYVSEKSTDAVKLLGDASSKLVRMSFLRDVDAEKLGEAFSDGFEKACKGAECKTFGEAVKAFVKLQPDVKKGETLDFELLQAEIIVKKNDKELGRVAGVGLGQVVLRVWIGDNPPNPELKVGLLGK